MHTPALGVGAKGLFIAAAVVVVVGAMRVAAPVLVPILLAACIAIAATPALIWLAARGIPKPVGLVVIVAVIMALLAALGGMLTSAMDELSRALPEYQRRLVNLEASIVEQLADVGLGLPEQRIMEGADARAFMGLLASSASRAAGVLSNLFLVLLIVVFILAEVTTLKGKVRAAFGKTKGSVERFSVIVAEVQKYFLVKTITSACTAALLGTWLAILNVDFVLLWVVMVFMLNYIPTVGSILAAIPPILIAFLQFGPGAAVAVALGYLAVNTVIGSIIEPRVMGRTLGLSPLVVLLSMIFWGWVLGAMGALIAVPITMVLKIALENSREFRWVGILLGPGIKPKLQKAASGDQGPSSPASKVA